jgi:hypothetical protein
VEIKFIKHAAISSMLRQKNDIILVESQAFFPAYFHTLESIKNMHEPTTVLPVPGGPCIKASLLFIAVTNAPYCESSRLRVDAFGQFCSLDISMVPNPC